jgi:hypothetical protein
MWSTERQVADYRERLAQVRSLRELQQVGRELHAGETEAGNVTVLSQMLAGAQTNPAFATATRDALALWTVEIEQVLTRVLADSPLGAAADVPGLARAVTASFIGMELLAAVDPDGDQAAFRALDQLGALLEYLDDLGPATRTAARRAVRAAVRRSGRRDLARWQAGASTFRLAGGARCGSRCRRVPARVAAGARSSWRWLAAGGCKSVRFLALAGGCEGARLVARLASARFAVRRVISGRHSVNT